MMLPEAATAHASARTSCSASPQKPLQRRVGKAPGFSMPNFAMKVAVDGTEHQKVNSRSLMKAAGDNTAFSGTMHRHAPAAQQMKISWSDASKVRSKIWEKRSFSSGWLKRMTLRT